MQTPGLESTSAPGEPTGPRFLFLIYSSKACGSQGSCRSVCVAIPPHQSRREVMPPHCHVPVKGNCNGELVISGAQVPWERQSTKQSRAQTLRQGRAISGQAPDIPAQAHSRQMLASWPNMGRLPPQDGVGSRGGRRIWAQPTPPGASPGPLQWRRVPPLGQQGSDRNTLTNSLATQPD